MDNPDLTGGERPIRLIDKIFEALKSLKSLFRKKSSFTELNKTAISSISS